jgi:hypothetical protein
MLSIHVPEFVDYGRQATVSGGVLLGVGEAVLLSAQPCSGTSTSRLVPASGGAWEALVAPRVTTAFTAGVGGVGESATVKVRPVVTLRETGRLAYVVKVRTPRSFAGREVHVGAGGRLLKRVVLRTVARSRGSYTSAVHFRLAPRDLRRYQETMIADVPRSACLAAATSNTLAVSRP